MTSSVPVEIVGVGRGGPPMSRTSGETSSAT